MENIIWKIACAAALLAPACAVEVEDDMEEEVSVETEELYATPVLLNGKYYYISDAFSEQCGLGSLWVATDGSSYDAVKWHSGDHAYYKVKSIPRGDYTYVNPYVAISWGVTIPWFCGSTWERMECSGPEDYIRLYWEPDSREIKVRCYGMCGDGSSPEDCYAY